MKKALAIVIALVLALCMTSAMAEEMQEIELGTSGIVFTIPAGYVAGEITAEDTDENQVGYYKSEASLVDFDLYQWAKADGETLESAAAAEAAEYEATAEMTEINGVTMWFYDATEEFDGTEYATATFMMENGDVFAEIVFWLDGDNAEETAAAILATVAVKETAEISEGGNEIVLGTSNLKITTSIAYEKGELTAEDTDEGQVGYYKSADSLVDFDVYQWAKAEGETAESVAMAEAAEYGENVDVAEIINNGLVIYGYYATEEFDGEEYETFTAITEAGNDFVEIVFWLDGEEAALIMTDILSTLIAF
ncbi:MAG: hypothetical protein Q4G19_02395 [Clostridia bacterium]|nr:hypothetical protein [Clostridia bacterium]